MVRVNHKNRQSLPLPCFRNFLQRISAYREILVSLNQETCGNGGIVLVNSCEVSSTTTSSSTVSQWCEGIDIVQADHAPQAGVAQGIFHGDLIRHQGGHQEELEEELEEEVERRVRRERSRHQTQVRMHG